ncbi:MAG: hypothetical protein K5648_01130 [Erysipelotrichaceae bacterium]|nr:hypothetical protein [Erysipelotrichaceae bacterium]
MAKQARYLRQIPAHLKERYGETKMRAVMDKALRRYDELLEENKEEPKAYHIHTLERIYPAIACFDAMISEGIDRKETADFLVAYYKWHSGSLVPVIKGVFRIPGLYRIVPRFFFGMRKKSFGPEAGFSSKDRFLSKTRQGRSVHRI